MLERHVIDGAGVYVGAGVGLLPEPAACMRVGHSQTGSRWILVALCPTGRGVLAPERQQLCPSLSSSQDAAGRVWRPGTQLSLPPGTPLGSPGDALRMGLALAFLGRQQQALSWPSPVFSAADLGVCAGSPSPPLRHSQPALRRQEWG